MSCPSPGGVSAHAEGVTGQHNICSICTEPQTPARHSIHLQVRAEKRAVELAAKAGLKLIAICPNFVLGPPLSSRVDSLSVGFMKVL